MSQPDAALNFRDFVSTLLDRGDAIAIHTEVDPHLEAAAITRRVYDTRSPAPLFEHLTGAAPGFRLLGAPAGLSRPGVEFGRVAAHIGLAPTATARDIVEHLIRAMHAEPIAPRVVEKGAVQENIRTGAEVDLEQFPVPLLHQQDGGRYFGTYGYHIVQTPDGSWTSWSISRSMLGGRNTLVGPAMPQQHLGMIHRMWRERGLPTPWAFIVGAPPASLVAAGMPLPEQVNEDGYVGALAGHAVDVVRAQTNDLLVPANAEIVLEGYISPDETAPEGPMGEYHGYQFDEPREQPVFHVEAVTHRNDPILPFCVAGVPPEENHTIWGTMISAVALDVLRSNGLPIDMAWCSYEAATCWIVLSVDLDALRRSPTTESELVNAVAGVLFSSHVGWLVPKILLVANDVDVTDITDVAWALATRHHPATGTYRFDDAPGIPLVPYLTDDDRAAGRGGKAVVSCLQPTQLAGVTSGTTANFGNAFPNAIRDRVLHNWSTYGFDGEQRRLLQ
jgi:4-hydroxy-3-polyprenylbenzoate decarboxylase